MLQFGYKSNLDITILILMMLYEEYFVHKKLANFIKKLWTIDNINNNFCVKGKGIVPNGCFTIAFITGQGLTVTNENTEFNLTEGIYFCGQITKAISVDIHPNTKAIMAQLFAWTPSYFTKRNMSMFTDRIIPLDETGIEITGQKQIFDSYPSICLFLTTTFKKAYNELETNLLLTVCKIILESNGEVAIKDISEKITVELIQPIKN